MHQSFSKLFVAETCNSLIVSGRIEYGHIQWQRASNPMRERRVIGKIVVGEWVDQTS
jgi:hypothetical protein